MGHGVGPGGSPHFLGFLPTDRRRRKKKKNEEVMNRKTSGEIFMLWVGLA